MLILVVMKCYEPPATWTRIKTDLDEGRMS